MKSILIVDDNLMMRKLIRNVFREEGYKIEEAKNGNEGLKLAQKNHFSLVITDIIMPEMEGLEFIMQLKRDFPDTKIIAISGSKPYYLYVAKKLGIDGVFTKPLNHTEFLNAVRKIMQSPTNDKLQTISNI